MTARGVFPEDLVEDDVAVLEALDEVGGSVTVHELVYKLRRRNVARTPIEALDTLYRLEGLGLVTPTHWTCAPERCS